MPSLLRESGPGELVPLWASTADDKCVPSHLCGCDDVSRTTRVLVLHSGCFACVSNSTPGAAERGLRLREQLHASTSMTMRRAMRDYCVSQILVDAPMVFDEMTIQNAVSCYSFPFHRNFRSQNFSMLAGVEITSYLVIC